MRIVKVGDLYLNVDRMSMARDHRCPDTQEPTGDLLIYFHDDKRARLKGAEADGVRRYLVGNAEAVSSGLIGSVDPGPDGGQSDA